MAGKNTKTNSQRNEVSSAGHLLGQLIGDWWEEFVILPLLTEIASELNLFIDNRSVKRTCRSEKIQWRDVDGNSVDYDYVLELGGTTDKKGIPVAFIESFWRRGARHSKDKARDDTTKLLPMRDTYPTARFLAIAACGEFTTPAKEYVRSRNVELFYIAKEQIIAALKEVAADVDYADNSPEAYKLELANRLQTIFKKKDNKEKAARKLVELAGISTFSSFKSKIIGSLTASPQEIEISSLKRFGPVVFTSIDEATNFLAEKPPKFPETGNAAHVEYKVAFSDGSDFFIELPSINKVVEVNDSLFKLTQHFNTLSKKKII